jgi:hypothetical protein
MCVYNICRQHITVQKRRRIKVYVFMAQNYHGAANNIIWEWAVVNQKYIK